ETGLNAATIACEADAAAAVMLVSEKYLNRSKAKGLKVLAGNSSGGSPSDPALVPISVAKALLQTLRISSGDLTSVELMEAYAVQAMVTADALGLEARALNELGGALARGHPIGASGAILAVQLFSQMMRVQAQSATGRSCGMALIAAAGGLGSGMVVERAC
ncbi:MAG: thiolase family protein, partial [Roseibium sp.]|nr:thiolase family protein [Roseibium sp.]